MVNLPLIGVFKLNVTPSIPSIVVFALTTKYSG
jgi:hypothetical protein